MDKLVQMAISFSFSFSISILFLTTLLHDYSAICSMFFVKKPSSLKDKCAFYLGVLQIPFKL